MSDRDKVVEISSVVMKYRRGEYDEYGLSDSVYVIDDIERIVSD